MTTDERIAALVRLGYRAEACDDTDRAGYLRVCAEADETLMALVEEADDDG